VNDTRNVRLRLVFREEKKPYLMDVSSLLYDFELLHDYSLLMCAEEYENYNISSFSWYRRGRPLKPRHKLRVARIVKESPFTVELILAGVVASSGALWTIVQIASKIDNWKLNKEKLRLEIKKLAKEIRETPSEEEKPSLDFEEIVSRRRAFGIQRQLIRRFEDNPIKLDNIELSIEEND